MSAGLDYWIPNCSPYIHLINYDIDKRLFVLECLENHSESKPHTRITCRQVVSYSESNQDDEFHDDCLDGLIDAWWDEATNTFGVLTDKKEITLKLQEKPIREVVT